MTTKTKIEVGDTVELGAVHKRRYVVLEKVGRNSTAMRHARKSGAAYTFLPSAGWLVIRPVTEGFSNANEQ